MLHCLRGENLHKQRWSIKETLQDFQTLRKEGGSGVSKTSLDNIKVKPVMEILLFAESQSLSL